jgi:hypothetical protein
MTTGALLPTTSGPTITTTSTFDRSIYFKLMNNEPLYTEINIPLPPLPSTLPAQTPYAPSNHFTSVSPPERGHDRCRARSLSSFSPFRTRSSSRTSDETARRSEERPRIKKEIVKNCEVAAAMNLSHQNKRSHSKTIDALAVVPAVLVLSAELFTPGTGVAKEGERKDSGIGRWEDGIR